MSKFVGASDKQSWRQHKRPATRQSKSSTTALYTAFLREKTLLTFQFTCKKTSIKPL